MISIKVNTTQLNTEIEKKITGIKEFSSPKSMEAIAKAAFALSAKDFIKKTNMRALSAPKAFHHVYEWDHIGQTRYKLFTINRTGVAGGNLKVSYSFLTSKTAVPINSKLRKPGRSGRFVSKEFVFKNKAQVMETGNPTKPFSARGRALVFVDKNKGIVFVKRPNKVSINRPGGRYTKGAFEKHFVKWFENPANIRIAIVKSGLLESIEMKMSKALSVTGAGKTEVLSAIVSASERYSKGVTKL